MNVMGTSRCVTFVSFITIQKLHSDVIIYIHSFEFIERKLI